ncbi:hypothetical protein D3C72_583980 [compost metagenome]
MWMASSMLLHILAIWPAPSAPAWNRFCPMQARMGLAASKSADSPPTIKVRVPAAAPVTPPETGASRKRMPRAFAASPTARAEATSMVEQSITCAPAGSAPSRSWPPPSDSQSPRTCSPAGSMLMARSQPVTASRASPAAIQPAAIALTTLSGIKSKTRTAWPALARFAAMGPPMLPSPINPILVISLLLAPFVIRPLGQRVPCLAVLAPQQARGFFPSGQR